MAGRGRRESNGALSKPLDGARRRTQRFLRIMPWFVYILECAGGHYYVGHTEDLRLRLAAHLAGAGAEFTRRYPPRRLACSEQFSDESSAVRREAQLKRWSHAKKSALIAGQFDLIHQLARLRKR